MQNETSNSDESRPLTKHNVNGWVAVTERLPEPYDRILFYAPKWGVRQGFREPRNRKIEWFQTVNRERCKDTTHWMPLPEPPCR